MYMHRHAHIYTHCILYILLSYTHTLDIVFFLFCSNAHGYLAATEWYLGLTPTVTWDLTFRGLIRMTHDFHLAVWLGKTSNIVRSECSCARLPALEVSVGDLSDKQ